MAVVMPALAITLLAHGLMMPAMLVPILFRLAGHACHDGHGKR
jgi:hypothetical protein